MPVKKKRNKRKKREDQASEGERYSEMTERAVLFISFDLLVHKDQRVKVVRSIPPVVIECSRNLLFKRALTTNPEKNHLLWEKKDKKIGVNSSMSQHCLHQYTSPKKNNNKKNLEAT